jgi:hypothetical protein
MLGTPECLLNCASHNADMWDPLLRRAHLSNTHRERQRGRETPVGKKTEEAGRITGVACSGQGEANDGESWAARPCLRLSTPVGGRG